jgi:4-hydroxy-tetrahydrodipicolinate reductase
MRFIISGYGRMGKEVEKMALASGHTIHLIIDTNEDWKKLTTDQSDADAVIDFSLPRTAVDNIMRCFELGLPIITGTTGWYGRLAEVQQQAEAMNGTLFYAPNFSIGVNLFFRLNRQLASLISHFDEYKPSLKEIHHIHKLDAPSGTAIKLAEDLVSRSKTHKSWAKGMGHGLGVLPVVSERTGEVPGTHIVRYASAADVIELRHEAINRTGFAKGAIIAAEWVLGKQGVYTMDNLMESLV